MLNESLASMGHSSIWKLVCSISVCNILTVSVHLSNTQALVVLDPPLAKNVLYEDPSYLLSRRKNLSIMDVGELSCR